MKLTDLGAEIRHGNTLLVPCQGQKPSGCSHCDGLIRIPFQPTLDGAELAIPNSQPRQPYWHRAGGSTLEDLTLTPSIQADVCGHFVITRGDLQKA